MTHLLELHLGVSMTLQTGMSHPQAKSESQPPPSPLVIPVGLHLVIPVGLNSGRMANIVRMSPGIANSSKGIVPSF